MLNLFYWQIDEGDCIELLFLLNNYLKRKLYGIIEKNNTKFIQTLVFVFKI